MLYIIGTPIGNLDDLSFRAVETFKKVDMIFCEDTRQTIKLLNHLNISKPLFSYHKFNESQVSKKIVEELKSGKEIGLVSDSGMPLVSDPGAILVKNLKENGLLYTVIPGASASLSALILSGLDSSTFTFVGFLPEKTTDKKELLKKVKNYDTTLIFYISPHNIEKDLNIIYEHLGKRRASLVKEITKIYERAYDFVLGESFEFDRHGEFVLVVDKPKEIEEIKTLSLKDEIEKEVLAGLTENQAIGKVAKRRNLSRNDVYKIIKLN